MTKETQRKLVIIRGLVQGVGFRPFIYNLAQQYDLTGWVNNTKQGVKIDVQGTLRGVTYFINHIKSNPPPLAQIEEITIKQKKQHEHQQFAIKKSREDTDQLTFVAPDAALCERCQEELMERGDRRYQYPFINCTNCGPRFSIIQEIPYDRSVTTMADFTMCQQCESEYQNPDSRRFHAQPNSCPDCGPKLQLKEPQGEKLIVKDPIKQTIRLLKQGKIVAVKGVGGFHLLCDGTNSQAITRLRIKKNRPDKALAVMMRDLATVSKYCQFNAQEEEILQGQRKPILLLEKEGRSLPQVIATDTNYLGVMLPYSPLHFLLMQRMKVLVATSGNLSGQPLEYTNQGAEENMAQLADYCLVHNRNIELPVDDAVVQVALNQKQVIRQGRGFAPQIIKIEQGLSTLACGGDLKNTFCLSRGEFAFLSQYTGSLTNLENYQRFKDNINHLKKLYHIEPQLIAHDLHPNYYTTHYAQELAGEKVAVQHHHAHLVSCMVEHEVEEPVIGIAFDGLGLGTDDQIWGGEFFICDYNDFTRVGHLNYVAQPGGDQAVKEPWRMAISYLFHADLRGVAEFFSNLKQTKVSGVLNMLKQDINCPLTSSMGRLFAATAALVGLCQKRSYQGQAAQKLETTAEGAVCSESYNYQLTKEQGQYQILTEPLITEMAADLEAEVAAEIIARKFHNTVIEFTVKLCQIIKLHFNLKKVVLSGGVWQNKILLQGVYQKLTAAGFKVYFPEQISCTDQGLALGQLGIANYKQREQ
jgi:hydrogenase maturation protein HypF